MLTFFKSLYLNLRLFYGIIAIAIIFFLSYWWEILYPIAWLMVLLLIGLFVSDLVMLFAKKKLVASRILPDKFSNSDPNPVYIHIQNNYSFPIALAIIDEIPIQFQKRDFILHKNLASNSHCKLSYQLTPLERGEYFFGNLNCYCSTKLGLVKRRYRFDNKGMVKVYPSFIQMKAHDFLSIDQRLSLPGVKKIRRLGHTLEFEQIKNYVRGDDIRTINWKATAKTSNLMVNQYQDEKSQPIYAIIDTSRNMKMPFEGLTLLDYAINSSLAFANIALKKNDQFGMLCYSNKINNFVVAKNRKTHLQRILETLYNIETDFSDRDIGKLYAALKQKITQRSLLMLYTNYEHISALQRELPYLKAIAKKHLLVVVMFENTELEKLIETQTDNITNVVEQTIAGQFKNDKKLMLKELQRNKIAAILTKPKDLTLNSINKYLEVKARGML